MSENVLRRPTPDEYNEYYSGYVNCVPEGELFEMLESQIEYFQSALGEISDEEASKVHEPYSWTIKQVVGHLIDAEKLFGWRAHRFGCGDETPLPGMDQNPYIDAIDYSKTAVSQLADELEHTRRSNLGLLRRLSIDAWDRVGTADGNPITVRALAYILVGHINHHMRIVEKRVA